MDIFDEIKPDTSTAGSSTASGDIFDQIKPDAPESPQKQAQPGFLSRVGTDLSNRFSNVQAAAERNPNNPAQFIVGATKEAAGGINDLAKESISSLTPDVIKQNAAKFMSRIAQTPLGKFGIAVLRSGGEKAEAFKKQFPDAAEDIEAVMNVLGARASIEGFRTAVGDPLRYGMSKMPTQGTAERLYGSATKMPLSKKWTQVLPGQEVADRTKAIRAGIENEVMPTAQGAAKVTMLEENAREAVDDVIDNLTAKGQIVRRDDIIKGLDKAYAEAKNSSKPDIAKSALDGLRERFMQRGEKLTPREVQDIKRQFYKETNYGSPPPRNVHSQFQEAGQKGLAHQAMLELETLHPELKAMNQTDAAYIKLKEGIERAVGRLGNKDIIGLGEEVAATAGGAIAGGPGAGIGFALKAALDMPTVKARLAFALKKAQTYKPKSYLGQGLQSLVNP